MQPVDLEQAAGLDPPTTKERPWLFGLLIAPNAVLAYGIISGVLSYLLRRQGVGIGQLIVSSCGGMMGTLRQEATRRKASSAYQGGCLAVGALGVFVLARLAE